MPLPKNILRSLRGLGVRAVLIEYSGVDDSGCIDSISCVDKHDKSVTLPKTIVRYVKRDDHYDAEAKSYKQVKRTVQLTLHKALEQYCYDVLEEKFAGWENNGGADGTFEFDISTGAINLTHNACYVERDTFEMEV